MNNDYCRPGWQHLIRISAAVLSCLSLFPAAAAAQAPEAPDGEKVTVSPNPEDPCPIPLVLAESAFAITCRSGTADLLQRLRRSDACGKEAKHGSGEACAVLIYVIDDYFSATEYGLPPTWTARIGKISQSDNIAETTVTILRSNSSEERLGPERVYELLLPIRLNHKVIDYEESYRMRRERADRSVNLREKQIRYYPALLVGRGKAGDIMNKEAIRDHFDTPIQVLQDVQKLMECMMNRYRTGC
jgi:hypothetical protein